LGPWKILSYEADDVVAAIVFTQVADPIGSGFVNSYARPEGNITGFTDFEPSIGGKWIEVLKEAVPFINRVMVLMDSNQVNHQAFLRVIESAASSLNMHASAATVRNRPEIEQAVSHYRYVIGHERREDILVDFPTSQDVIGLSSWPCRSGWR
jgi:ABC-type uncharacterized transport system substrate-binding protein